jgi:hypothetical protein
MQVRDDCGRLSPRHVVLLRARCRKSSWHVIGVELSDISEGGCCIVGISEEFVANQRVSLRLANFKAVEAEVRWSQGDRAGLAFLAPLSRAQIEQLAQLYGIPDKRQFERQTLGAEP